MSNALASSPVDIDADALSARYLSIDPAVRYRHWRAERLPRKDDLYRQRLACLALRRRPVVSIITPVFDTPPDLLDRMLRSVVNQTYPHWEHCLVDDGSSSPWLARYLERCAARDRRVRFERRAVNGGIVAASNHAFGMTTGEFVSMLDHDDELDSQALYAIVELHNQRQDIDVFYSDFDMIDRRGRHAPGWFLPDWSPELLWSWPYVAHLTVFRRSLVEGLGGWRAAYEGSQDYDLALRAASVTDNIVHVPQVLYHWRQWERSVANNPRAKPYAYVAAKAAISDHIARNGIAGTREDRAWDHVLPYVIRFDIIGQPLVSIVAIPGDDAPAETYLARLRRLVADGGYTRCEVVIVAPGAWQRQNLDVSSDDGVPMRLVGRGSTGDAGALANLGAAHAGGDHLLFLTGALEAVEPGWLSGMLEYSQQTPIGAVGARILLDGELLWHAGVLMPKAVPRLLRVGYPLVNFSAVSGVCLMTSRADFDLVGGFRDAGDVGYADLDYCLRLGDRGRRHVVPPSVRVRATGTPEEPFTPERQHLFAEEWASRRPVDPYYNPNFDQNDVSFLVRPASWPR